MEDIIAGDIVAVQHPGGRREGLVVGSHIDYAGRQVVEVQLDPTEPVYYAHYPTVTRVRRTTYYNTIPAAHKVRTVERRVYW